MENSHIVASVIELQTHDDKAILQLKAVEKFKDGSGYKCDLFVQSSGFSVECPFYFDEFFLTNALSQLKVMAQTFQGKVIIGQQFEEGHIQIAANRYGHVMVSGTILEQSEQPQRLDFAFRTDQTVLEPLIRDFTQLVES